MRGGARRAPGVGVVPRFAAGWEPLAAVYSREILPLVRRQFGKRNLALHRLVDAGVAAGRLLEQPVPPAAAALFRNVNAPGDLGGTSESSHVNY